MFFIVFLVCVEGVGCEVRTLFYAISQKQVLKYIKLAGCNENNYK